VRSPFSIQCVAVCPHVEGPIFTENVDQTSRRGDSGRLCQEPGQCGLASIKSTEVDLAQQSTALGVMTWKHLETLGVMTVVCFRDSFCRFRCGEAMLSCLIHDTHNLEVEAVQWQILGHGARMYDASVKAT